MSVARLLMPDEPITKTLLRLTSSLHQRLQVAARRNRRSLHSQIIWYIERGIEADERAQSDESR